MKKLFKATFNRQSWAGMIRESNYYLNYNIGIKTIPKTGKIFVFENVEDLMIFLLQHHTKEDKPKISVFEGTGTNPRKIKKISTIDRIIEFWKRRSLHLHPDKYEVYDAPKGTVVVDNFTPKIEYSFDEFKRMFANNRKKQ